jgi:hypothetical protein
MGWRKRPLAKPSRKTILIFVEKNVVAQLGFSVSQTSGLAGWDDRHAGRWRKSRIRTS